MYSQIDQGQRILEVDNIMTQDPVEVGNDESVHDELREAAAKVNVYAPLNFCVAVLELIHDVGSLKSAADHRVPILVLDFRVSSQRMVNDNDGLGAHSLLDSATSVASSKRSEQ